MKKAVVYLTTIVLLLQYVPAHAITPPSGVPDSTSAGPRAKPECNIALSLDEIVADATIYCPKCGAENSADARYCAKCGATLQTQQYQPPVVIKENRGTSTWEVIGIVAAVLCGVCLILYVIGLAASSS